MTGQNRNSHRPCSNNCTLERNRNNRRVHATHGLRRRKRKKEKKGKITVRIQNNIVKYLHLIQLTFSSVVHSILLPFKYFSTVVQLKSGAYLVDGMEVRPLVNSNRLLHLSCSDRYSSSSASIMIILFFSTFFASNMTACLVRRQIVCFILGGHLCCTYIKQTHNRHSTYGFLKNSNRSRA